MRRVASSSLAPWDLSVRTVDGVPTSLDRFRGQVLLIVNVASRCVFTGQYDGLEALYRRHRDAGFVVLAFPCDQFGHQEPGDAGEIRRFCDERFGITFPIFEKVHVNGPQTHPLFAFLKRARRGWLGSEAIKWNFTKFLMGRDGDVMARYRPDVRPDAIEPDVVRALDARRTGR
jgi:glutathione peroxidase